MRGAMSRLAAATLVAICLSMLPSPLHATKGKATAARVKSHSGPSASSSASSLGRLLAYDLPLPHDWIRESERDAITTSYSYSYSFSFAYSPTPSPTSNPTTIPVLAPTVQDPPQDAPQDPPQDVPQPGPMPIVEILLLLAGSPQQQDAAIAALITYLVAYMQQNSGQNVVVMAPQAPEPINRHRILLPAPEGRLCKTDAPQDESSIDLRNYDDVAQVQEILTGIMNGTIVLTAVQEDGTSLPVKDSICRAETTLNFVSPPTDTLDDKSNIKEGPKPLSPLYIALIAVAGVSLLFAAIFLARRHMAPKRSAVVVSS